MEPAILLVGATENMEHALSSALLRHRVFVESATIDGVADAVLVAAPDLIVLMGEAAKDCGSPVLEKLAVSPLSSVVPVAIVDDNADLDARLRAFRHGAAAVIPRSASIDAIADRIARLAREIPERQGEALGNVGEATLEEFVAALSTELRSGILSVRGTGEGTPVRLVLGGGRPLAEVIDDFVGRVRGHVVHAEPLQYEFDERAAGTVQLLGADDLDEAAQVDDVAGLRIVLADDDTARADNVAQELRAHGAVVVVTDLEPTDLRFSRLRQVDPAVLLIGEDHVQGKGYQLVRKMRHDTRLRWASLLVVRWDEVWTEKSSVPAVERIAGTLAALAEPERSLLERVQAGVAFDTRLETTGPARLLRALTAGAGSCRITIQNPRVTVQVDLGEELVVGATGKTAGPAGRDVEGSLALSAMLVLSGGRVHIQRVEQPATANIMSTVDVALNMADDEAPPIAPSIPVPGTTMGSGARHEGEAREDVSVRIGRWLGERPVVRWAMMGLLAAAQLLLLLEGLRRLDTELWPVASAETAREPVAVATAAPTPGTAAGSEASARPEPSAEAPAKPKASAEAPAKPKASAEAATKPKANAGSKAPPRKPGSLPLVALSDVTSPSCEKLLENAPAGRGNYPGAAYQQLKRARRELVRGSVEKAQEAYCQAIAWDPENVPAITELARVLLIRRDGNAAINWARRAAKLNPESDVARGLLGDALAFTGDYDGARRAWLKTTRTKPRETDKIKALAERDLTVAKRMEMRRDYPQAERFYLRSTVLNPRLEEAVAGLVRMLVKQKSPEAAVQWARYLTDIAPEDPMAHVLLGDALDATGNRKEAATHWRKANELDPTHREAGRRMLRIGSGD